MAGGARSRRTSLTKQADDRPAHGDKEPGEAFLETNNEDGETVHEDHLCPICQLLLFRPVTTTCNHTLCESCLERWADASGTSQMTIVSLDDVATVIAANLIEARCPMCRTSTTATLNSGLEGTLRSRYPSTYSSRQDDQTPSTDDALIQTPSTDDALIETMTLYIGNTHRLKASDDSESSNIHDWTFFVRPSRIDVIEEVHILLHPTFRPSRVTRSLPPYEIRRLGWGYFTVTAAVVLKAGYSWVSDRAQRGPDGAENGMRLLRWTLDFGGNGSQGRYRLKIERNARGEEEVERDRARMRRAYERDGNWIPESVDS